MLLWYNKGIFLHMPQSKRLTFDQIKQSEFSVSDMLRQQRLQSRLANNDQALVKNSWKDFGHTFTDRYYKDSARKRAGVVSNLYRQARQEAKNVKNSGAGDQALAIAAAPIQQATSQLLQQSWLNLIDSFGATLIWINVHWFLNITMGDKLFCDLGKEWLPKVGKGGNEGGGPAMDAILGIPLAGLGIVEKLLILILDLIVCAVLLLVVVLIILLINVVKDPLHAILEDFGFFWEVIKALL